MSQPRKISPSRPLLSMRLSRCGEPVYRARARLHNLGCRLGFAGEALDGIVLAFSEAVTNAILHGTRGSHRWVNVHVTMQGDDLVLEVADHGPGFQPSGLRLPAPDDMRETGRGLFLMRAFMDDVQWHGSPSGTTVRMSKRRA